jgi:protein kinase-like protein
VSDTPVGLAEALRDRYVLERELGRGGMATVWLARDLRHERLVALKVLHHELVGALGPERFLREIAIAARLQHPNILPLFDSGTAVIGGGAARPYYVMPYVAGESLRARLERETQLGLEAALGFALQVGAALSHAHAQGIVHRDIKPENILLENGHALVADFGIAQALDLAGGEKLTETGLSLGTPVYMSPEQAAAGRVDARADIYSLACVLYEMLAGTPPFTGATPRAIMARHALDPVPPLRTTRPEVPGQLDTVLHRALAKVPADRFGTAEEFAQALQGVRSHRPRFHRWSRRPAPWLAFPAIGLALAGGVLLATRAPHPAVLSNTATIAVLPALPATNDTLLSRLGRDLAVTIAASLDGLGDIRTVDRLTIAAATAGERGPLSLEESVALGRRFGAGSVLRGTLVRVGQNVRLDLDLYQGLRAVTSGLVATAPLDSVGSLTDSVTWALLRQIWQRGAPPTPSLTSLTTHSVPALRAFLEGERELSRNRWDEAALAYRSALAADSTFWLAYQRYAETQAWREEPTEPDLLDRLARHRNALPDRDRLLADAILSAREPSSVRTLGLYEEVTRRFPDYWPGWFLYGDRLVHFGGLLGYPWTRARDALQHALAGNPALVPAWHHLFLISVGRDTALPAQCVARLVELGFFASRPGQNGFRELAELSRHGGVLPDSLSWLTDSTARMRMPRSFALEPTYTLRAGFPAAQIEHNRRVLKLGVDPEIAAAHLMSTALAWAARGAWDSALAAIDSATEVDPGPTSALEAYRLAVLSAWVGVVDPAEAVKRRHPAWLALKRLPADPPPIGAPARLRWLDGLLAYSQRDRQGIEQARQALRQHSAISPPDRQELARMVTSFNDRSLAALELALKGDSGRAGRQLAALEWECAGLWTCPLGNYDLAVQHLAGARWLLAAGDTAQAVRLLMWPEAFQNGFAGWSGTLALTPLADLELARIYEARGAASEARERYQRFLRNHDAPMPSERPLIEAARQALARLSGSTRSS